MFWLFLCFVFFVYVVGVFVVCFGLLFYVGFCLCFCVFLLVVFVFCCCWWCLLFVQRIRSSQVYLWFHCDHGLSFSHGVHKGACWFNLRSSSWRLCQVFLATSVHKHRTNAAFWAVYTCRVSLVIQGLLSRDQEQSKAKLPHVATSYIIVLTMHQL